MAKQSNTKVTIDGTEYVVPVMKFKTLKKAFPFIEKVSESDNLIEMSEAAQNIVSLALMQDPRYKDITPEFIEENIDVDENTALAEALQQMLIDSGLVSKEQMVSLAGKLPGAAPSTEISTPSSQNLSQPGVPEETGT